MKDYKIDKFNEIKLIEVYNKLLPNINDTIVFRWVRELIFDLFKLGKPTIKISVYFYYQELLRISFWEWTWWFVEKYLAISDEWELLLWFDKVSYEDFWGTCKDLTYITTEYENYICDDDINIYLSRKAEVLYNIFDRLWLKILGYSWILSDEIGWNLKDEWVDKEYNFIINIENRDLFVNNSIQTLAENIREKKYTIERLEETVLSEIIILWEEFWRWNKNIPYEIKEFKWISKYDILSILLILHLKNKIELKEYSNHKNELYINLLQPIEIKTNKNKFDKRKLKRWIKAENLILSLNSSNTTLKVYFKSDNSHYLDILLSDLGFLTIKWKTKKSLEYFTSFINGEEIDTLEKNRKQIKEINDNFKKELKIIDNIISPKNGKYVLVPDIKLIKTSDDVLWHPWRYVSLNENVEYYDDYYLSATNTINRNY